MVARRAELVELRVLDGPNLYFRRPAIKLTLGVEGWLSLPEDRVESALARAAVGGRAVGSLTTCRQAARRCAAARSRIGRRGGAGSLARCRKP